MRILRALRERLLRSFRRGRASAELARGDKPEAAATRSGRRNVGF
jgi:hypothetical protein